MRPNNQAIFFKFFMFLICGVCAFASARSLSKDIACVIGLSLKQYTGIKNGAILTSAQLFNL